MASPQELVAVWCAGSIALAVIENTVFLVWLRRKGAQFDMAWSGVPGYLDRAYSAWCGKVGRSPQRVLWIRRLILLNLLISVVAALPLLGHGR